MHQDEFTPVERRWRFELWRLRQPLAPRWNPAPKDGGAMSPEPLYPSPTPGRDGLDLWRKWLANVDLNPSATP